MGWSVKYTYTVVFFVSKYLLHISPRYRTS